MRFNDISNLNLIRSYEMEYTSLLTNDTLSFLKHVAALANANGGDLYVGVDDDANLIGLSEDEVEVQKQIFYSALNHLSGDVEVCTKLIPYKCHNKICYLIKFHIEKSFFKPVILFNNDIPSIYIRRQGYSNGATTSEIHDMYRYTSNIAYDKQLTNVKFDPDDFTKLYQVYLERNEEPLTKKKLKSLGFMDNEDNLYKGSTYFMDNPTVGIEFRYMFFTSTNKSDSLSLVNNKVTTNILDGIEELSKNIKTANNLRMDKLENSRIDTYSFPLRSVFEGLVNAVAHRDYSIRNSEIQAVRYLDRLEITSPGTINSIENLTKTYNLDTILTVRRNELICNILVSLKYMEASGTGFEKIMADYKQMDEDHKPFISSTNNNFTLTLPDINYQDGVTTLDMNLYYPKPKTPSKHDNDILSLCYSKAKTALEIAENLGISNSTYLRNTILANLVNEDLLIQDQNGRNKTYLTNPKNVKRN